MVSSQDQKLLRRVLRRPDAKLISMEGESAVLPAARQLRGGRGHLGLNQEFFYDDITCTATVGGGNLLWFFHRESADPPGLEQRPRGGCSVG